MNAGQVRQFAALIALLPDDAYLEANEGGLWLVNVVDVAAMRAHLPAAVWVKSREDGLSWWWYKATMPDGTKVCINTYTAPPTCRAIIEEYEAVEKVPVTFKEKTVIKKRTRWECGPEEVTA